MNYYPVCLDIRDRHCLIIGGGSVGTRKAEALLRCGACVTVISQDISDRLKALAAETDKLMVRNTVYTPGDLDGMTLVFCATSDRRLNQRIADDSKQRGILCNVADIPEASDFIVPSVVRRGDLTIAVSTAGSSPAFAKKLRKDLSEQFGDEYEVFLELMGKIRKKLLAGAHDPHLHKTLFEKLIEGQLLKLIKNNDRIAVDALLLNVLGPGFGTDDLRDKKESE